MARSAAFSSRARASRSTASPRNAAARLRLADEGSRSTARVTSAMVVALTVAAERFDQTVDHVAPAPRSPERPSAPVTR